jgi:hypothetical protein
MNVVIARPARSAAGAGNEPLRGFLFPVGTAGPAG